MRHQLAVLATAIGLAVSATGCSLWSHHEKEPEGIPSEPIVFVHGDGDNSSLWITTAWRFESNGWPADRLFAFSLPHPVARDVEDVEQANTTSGAQYTAFLAARIDEVKRQTGSARVILIGNSRGGYPIRRYVTDGGAASVAAAITGGTPNHGTYISPTLRPNSEYNGMGSWLTALNAPQGPDHLEVTPGVRFLTLRSDHNDKYAQPTGIWFGMPQLQTRIGYDGPALKGAKDVILPGVDHRETAYSLQAFDEVFKFLTGSGPTADILGDEAPSISGQIFAIEGGKATNVALPDTHVTIYAVETSTGARTGAPLLNQAVGADGVYGPVKLARGTHYEIMLEHADYAVTHIYPSAILRSTKWLNFAPQAVTVSSTGASVVQFVRISGYFNPQRDHITLDNMVPKEIQTTVPAVAQATVSVPPSEAMRPVIARYNDESIVVAAWPGKDSKNQSQRVVAQLLD